MVIGSTCMLNSCLLDSPFEPVAKIPVDEKLLGRWESEVEGVAGKTEATPILLLQHSANEYQVQMSSRNKEGQEGSVFFRAYCIELGGGAFIQAQVIGTDTGPVKVEDRDYMLIKVTVKGDTMSIETLDLDVLGVSLDAGSEALKSAFLEHKDDPNLFSAPSVFKRVKKPAKE